MNTTLKFAACCSLLAALLIGCEEGPSGPNPGQELSIIYSAGILDGLVYNKSADLQMHGDMVRTTFLPLGYDTLKTNEAHFDLTPIQTFNDPEVRLIFKGSLPTAPGTYDWEETKISAGSMNVQVIAGPVVSYETVKYFPLKGKTVITNVTKDGNGNIVHIDGYFNGTLRSQWPDGANSLPNPLPPDFDITNPTLVGENLTVSSCIFFSRSRSVVRPVQ